MTKSLHLLSYFFSLQVTLTLSTFAQGTFRNLDFEAARLAFLPESSFRLVPAEALPAWTAAVDGAPVPFVPYNAVALSQATISLHDHNSASPPLSGNYSVILQSSFPPKDVSSIAQAGAIASDAKTLLFTQRPGPLIGPMHASIGGNEIRLTLLQGTGEMSTPSVWGGDISKYAGQTVELKFWGDGMLDNIVFSPVEIPEPNGSLLLLLAAGLGLRRHNIKFILSGSDRRNLA